MNDSTNLLILIGSPRKSGNCAFLTRAAADAARAQGASVEVVCLHDLDIGACEGCHVCRESVDAECILDDGMTALYPKLRAADAILARGVMPLLSHRNQATVRLARWQSMADPPAMLGNL